MGRELVKSCERQEEKKYMLNIFGNCLSKDVLNAIRIGNKNEIKCKIIEKKGGVHTPLFPGVEVLVLVEEEEERFPEVGGGEKGLDRGVVDGGMVVEGC
jgi:hypothetical protein